MATETTVTSAQAWSPDVVYFPQADILPTSLVNLASTVAGSIEGDAPSVRVPYVSDDDAQVTAEGDLIPDAGPALDEALVHTSKITQLVRLSREQYTQEGTAEQIAQSTQRAVLKKSNQLFVAQVAPTPPAVAPVAGLANWENLTEMEDPVTDSLDVLVDLISTLESEGAMPNIIVMAPDSWAELRKFRTATDANTTILGAGTNDAVKMLLSIPVVVDVAVPSATGFVIDSTQIVSAASAVEVATSEHAAFANDSILVRCVYRQGHTVVRPERIGMFTVGTGGE